MQVLGLNKAIDQMVMAKSAHWHGHMLRSEYTKKDIVDASEKKFMSLNKEDKLCRSKWTVVINHITIRLT